MELGIVNSFINQSKARKSMYNYSSKNNQIHECFINLNQKDNSYSSILSYIIIVSYTIS